MWGVFRNRRRVEKHNGMRALAAFAWLLLLAHPLATSTSAPASPAGEDVGPSGLPVPRFVSLKASRVNVRVGPGEDYKVAWVFVKPGLPLEVVQEYDNWRRIRDSDGSMGWVFRGLLSGKRTAVVAPWAGGDPRPIRAGARADASIVAYLEPGVMGDVDRCQDGWCRISGKGFSGWIDRDQLWGVYPNEDIN